MVQVNKVQETRGQILDLLEGQRLRLDKMLAMDLLRESGDDGAARSLDRAEAQRLLSILDNEARKVERMEMVLAVVGTMKAGKSTAINAIVGAEVLPNRNQPMTALPTLIRHAAERAQPVLTFPKRGPMIAMAAALQAKLRRLAQDGRLQDVELFNEPDGSALIRRIIDGDSEDLVPDRCDGPDQVFPFLRDLNDLARLARDPAVGLELPLDAYQAADELPVIEIAFSHLGDETSVEQGTLALLDTPGHNECGQSRALLQIVREQLARASAVVAVLDYTQLRSEAEDEVRRELAEIADQTEDRLVLLVNKFDQKDRHGMTADELKRLVADGLMEGRVAPERVYPVSARYAYLANLALATMDARGRLPDPKTHSWVEDFANLALGSFWEEQLGNAEKVRAAARKLWHRSQFEAPLRQVVRKAARQAAILTMKAALAKLAEHGRTIDNFMRLRRGALSQEAAAVQAMIAGLDHDIATVDVLRGDAGTVVSDVTVLFEDFIERLQQTTLARLDAALATAVSTQARVHRLSNAEEPPASEPEPPAPPVRPLGQRQSVVFGKRAVSPSAPRPAAAPSASAPTGPATLRLPNAEAAEAAARAIALDLQAILDRNADEAAAEFARTCAEMQRSLGGRIGGTVAELLERTQSRMSDRGVVLDLDFPEPKIAAAAADFGLTVGDILARRSERKTGRRARDGLSAEFGRLLWGGESDSGYETYVYNDIYYEIDPSRIRGRIAADLEAAGFELRSQARAYARDQVEPRLEQYFGDLRRYLDGFRGDLLDGIADHELDDRTVAELARQLEEMAAAGQESAGDIAAMRDGFDDAILWAVEDEASETVVAPRLHLSPAGGGDVTYDGASGRLTIGRSPDCTITVNSGVTSRNHASIELKDGVFVITDHSTNGTVVVVEGGRARVLKHESLELARAGQIGIGAVPDEQPEAAILFKVE